MKELTDANVKVITTLGDLKEYVYTLEAAEKDGLSNESLIGISNDNNLCIKPIYKDPDEKSKHICEDCNNPTDYNGLIPRENDMINRIKNDDIYNKYESSLNTFSKGLRDSNDYLSNTISQFIDEANDVKTSIISHTIKDVLDIDKQLTKSVIDTLLELSAQDLINTKVDMIISIDNNKNKCNCGDKK